MIFSEGQGLFIVIEGLDGAGTTTQARSLHAWLFKATGAAYLTQEPSQGPAGAQIRSILTGRLKADPETLALLFATDRLDHLYYGKNGFAHRLASGCHVICDRYYLSSLAYQSLDTDLRWIYQLNDHCIRPDLTLFLEVPVKICMRRITASRGFHYELYENAEKLSLVNERYKAGIEHLRKEGENIQIVKGDLPLESVHTYIRERVSPLLSPDWLTPRKQQDLLIREMTRPLSFFVDIVSEKEGLFLLSIRTINNGYQALFASSERERPIPVNFFPRTGRITPQGPLDLTPRLKEIALEAQTKMYAGRLF